TICQRTIHECGSARGEEVSLIFWSTVDRPLSTVGLKEPQFYENFFRKISLNKSGLDSSRGLSTVVCRPLKTSPRSPVQKARSRTSQDPAGQIPEVSGSVPRPSTNRFAFG